VIKFQISADAWGTLVAGLLSRWPRAVRLLASQTRLEATRAPVRRTHRPSSHLLALHRTPRRELSRPPLPTEHRSRRARTPPRKRVAPSAYSLAVTSSTSSTSQPGQSSLGKGVFAVLPHRSHGGSSPELALHAASCPRALSTLPLARARS